MLLPGIIKSQDLSVTWDYRGQTFIEFAAGIENNLNVRCFYRNEWIKNLKLGEYRDCRNLQCILDNLFRGTALHYFIDKNNNIIITKTFIIKSTFDEISSEESPGFTLQAAASKTSSGDTIRYTIGNPRAVKSGNQILSGKITSLPAGEPVAGASIHIADLNLGTSSGSDGSYSLSLPRGSHLISYSFIGMQSKVVRLEIFESGVLDIDLAGYMVPLEEVVVTDQKTSIIGRTETGLEKINITSVRLLPSSFGETDIIRSLLLLTGVKSAGEGAAGFNVRGGSADQNLILLHGAPVYNPFHLFGFFPAFNSNIIQEVSLYKGGIPSRYGGRISSVLDIQTRNGDMKDFKGGAGIGPLTTDLVIEGPIIKDTLSYLFAGRTTYSDWIFDLIKNPDVNNSQASFYDLNGSITFSPDRKNKLELAGYLSNDKFRFISNLDYQYSNGVASLNWRHFFSSLFHSSLLINRSSYDYSVRNDDIPAEAYTMSHSIISTALKYDFNLIKARNDINFGIDLTHYSVEPGNISPANDSSIVMAEKIRRERAYEAAMFIEDRFKLTEFLTLNLGLRYSGFAVFGPKTIYEYSPDLSKSSSTIMDTIFFKPGQIVKWDASPELRGSMNFKAGTNTSFKINYNRTRQYLHLLTNTTTISPTDTWKLSDYYLKPETSDQFAAGFYQLLFRKSLEITAEAYYKEIKNIADYKGGTSLSMAENIEQHLVNARGKAYGIELSLKKTEGKFLFNLGYTWSRTFIQSRGRFREETINNGSWYPANFDMPHDMFFSFNYLYSRRFSLSGNFVYSTGRPFTLPLSSYRIRNIFLVDYSDRNAYRMPENIRFDIACKISGNLRTRKIANPHMVISVYNLFGRENPYSIYFKKEQELLEGYVLSLFGRPVPSITFRFDF
jgi:hypothetical protein